MTDISKAHMVKNGMDIVKEIPYIPEEMLIESVVGFTQTAFVHFLNDNGHPLAAQALDDAWHDRADQWWRQFPEQYDQRFMTGDELLDYREREGL